MNIPLNIDWQQILLHLLNFAILAGGLYFLLYKPVKDFMDKRTAYYKEMDDQANARLASADQLVKERQQKLDSVEEEIRARRAEAQADADRATEQQLAETKAQAAKILAEAKANADREHDRMMNAAKRELSELAIASAEKAMRSSKTDSLDQFLNIAEGGNAHDGA